MTVKTNLSPMKLIERLEQNNHDAYDSWLKSRVQNTEASLEALRDCVRTLIAVNDVAIHFLKTQALIRVPSHIRGSNRGEQK